MDIRDRIKNLVKDVFNQLDKKPAEYKPAGLDTLTDYPELFEVLNELFDNKYHNFVRTIDWVSPLPTTFRIVLVNGSEFYLIYSKNSWIAQVAGKKYMLINITEKQRAVTAISRLLRFEFDNVSNSVEGGEDDMVSDEIEDDVETEEPAGDEE